MKATANRPNLVVIQGAGADPAAMPPAKRLTRTGGKCVHMIEGRVNYKLCAWSLECSRCAFNQQMEDGLAWIIPASVPERIFAGQAV